MLFRTKMRKLIFISFLRHSTQDKLRFTSLTIPNISTWTYVMKHIFTKILTLGKNAVNFNELKLNVRFFHYSIFLFPYRKFQWYAFVITIYISNTTILNLIASHTLCAFTVNNWSMKFEVCYTVVVVNCFFYFSFFVFFSHEMISDFKGWGL